MLTPTVAVSGESDAQPTVYFEETAKAGEVFALEYEFDYTVTYRNLNLLLDTPAYCTDADLSAEEERAFAPENMQEEVPHMMFTEQLKTLCKEIVGAETERFAQVKKDIRLCYDGDGLSFVRDYASIDNLSEYCALNRRGDCGVQSLLFITLCRIAGIPAQWESGLEAAPDYVGEHDWAKFFIRGIGWLYADLAAVHWRMCANRLTGGTFSSEMWILTEFRLMIVFSVTSQ